MAMTKRIDLISCHQGKVPKASKTPKQLNNSASSPSASPTTTPYRKTPTEIINNSSPRASPGLVAGYYAGCKFTDPPSASTLPLPPQHWMITEEENHQTNMMMMFPFKISSSSSSSNDFTQQLKLLLKVQG